MIKISAHIADGATAFLKAQYKVLGIFVVCVSILLALTANSKNSHPLIGVSFILGAFCSALSGFIGMRVITGVLLAIFQSNAGGAWDNGKKSFEGADPNPSAEKTKTEKASYRIKVEPEFTTR